ncbi:hypothetical protein K474DRAFT_660730 [Panus rudis PR-1116 ss-1]|nr:hypothetical protein K474DRAFT_660730 [Panus rudis PR-1116 ss-1]
MFHCSVTWRTGWTVYVVTLPPIQLSINDPDELRQIERLAGESCGVETQLGFTGLAGDLNDEHKGNTRRDRSCRLREGDDREMLAYAVRYGRLELVHTALTTTYPVIKRLQSTLLVQRLSPFVLFTLRRRTEGPDLGLHTASNSWRRQTPLKEGPRTSP